MQTTEKDPKTLGFIIGYHIVLIFGLSYYFSVQSASLAMWMVYLTLFILTGLSITAGYHRLFSHSAYKAKPLLESFYLIFGTLALQQSAIKWSHDHRNHHAFVDTDKDPYSINKGFMFAHVLWLFNKAPPIDKKIVSDLFRDPKAAFQHRFYYPLAFGGNILVALITGYFCNDYLGGFLIAFLLRVFTLHHSTWFINSLAHTWGTQSFSNEHTAMDNMVISFLTFGEGYHNYHHTFANDYRNGVKWFNFDPTKWLIWTMSKVGLAYDLKVANEARVQKHILDEQKGEVLDKIKDYLSDQKEAVESRMNQLSDDLLKKYKDLSMLQKKIQKAKNEHADKSVLLKLKKEMKEVKHALNHEHLSWQAFCKQLVKFKNARPAQEPTAT